MSNSGDLDGTTVYHYNGHRIIETRDGSANVVMQVYHGTRYIDEVVSLRLPEGRVYVHQDNNYNVIALTDVTGRELERYYYSPYGELEAAVDAHFFDYDDDGDVDATDLAAATSGGACWGDYSGDCKRLDADCDRDIDADDHTAISNYIDAHTGDMALKRVPAASYSPLGNPFGHQGLVLDPEIDSYQNRMRQYAPKPKRFMQRDPLTLRPRAESGYQDGINLYEYVGASPGASRDPRGLKKTSPLIKIKQTPYCLFGNPGHTWFDCPGCWLWGYLDWPVYDNGGYIELELHNCQDDWNYINNVWEVHIHNDMWQAEFQECLENFLYWSYYFECPLEDYSEASGGCNCRNFVDEALDYCGGWKVLTEVLWGAPFRFCSSYCATRDYPKPAKTRSWRREEMREVSVAPRQAFTTGIHRP